MLFGVGVSCRILYYVVSYLYVSYIAEQLPRMGKRELICLLSFTYNYVASLRKGFLLLWVLGMGYVIFVHSLSLPYIYFGQLIKDDEYVIW